MRVLVAFLNNGQIQITLGINLKNTKYFNTSIASKNFERLIFVVEEELQEGQYNEQAERDEELEYYNEYRLYKLDQ